MENIRIIEYTKHDKCRAKSCFSHSYHSSYRIKFIIVEILKEKMLNLDKVHIVNVYIMYMRKSFKYCAWFCIGSTDSWADSGIVRNAKWQNCSHCGVNERNTRIFMVWMYAYNAYGPSLSEWKNKRTAEIVGKRKTVRQTEWAEYFATINFTWSKRFCVKPIGALFSIDFIYVDLFLLGIFSCDLTHYHIYRNVCCVCKCSKCRLYKFTFKTKRRTFGRRDFPLLFTYYRFVFRP